MKRIIAIVVTYNRKILLLECITALLQQTYPLFKVLIVDNASTDGTEDFLRENDILENSVVDYRKMKTNTGGSGGFYAGMEIVAKEYDVDWLWIMDDDTIPRKNALEMLTKAADCKTDASFFASCVEGMQHEPMNVPEVDVRGTNNGYPDWYMQMEQYLVKIRSATFVSLLINRKALDQCGLPCKDYFIWGDDTEYTLRLTKYYGAAWLVGNSWVCHKRKNAGAISIFEEKDPKRIKNYFFLFRNTLVNTSVYEGKKSCYKQFFQFVVQSMKILPRKNGLRKFWIIQKGIWNGLTQKRKFQAYIQSQLTEK